MLIVQGRSRTENYPVKNTVNGTQGTLLSIYTRKRQAKNNPVRTTINVAQGTGQFSLGKVRL